MVNYTLNYFPIRGLAEPARLLLHYAGQEFTDKRLTNEQWLAMKPLTPYGQLPILEVDGHTIAQSGAIYRFLGNKFGLCGKDEWESAEIDSIMFALLAFGNEVREFFAVSAGRQEGDKAALFENQFKPAAEKYLPAFHQALSKTGSGYFVKSGISYIDFVVAENVDKLNGLLPEFFAKHPSLLQHSKRVMSLPELQKYLSTRPQSAF
uniref:glutathione transferase n=1 Tax=Panagrolaimus superbus TaxID=310955 RepID=A0A914Z2L6_9BILA